MAATAPSEYTYLNEIQEGVWVAFDPQKGGVYLLSSKSAEIVQRLISGEMGTNGNKSFDLSFLKESKKPKHEPFINVWLSVNNFCNMGCTHCYIDKLNKHISSQRNNPLFIENIDFILRSIAINAKKNGYKKVKIRLAGGEPLLSVSSIKKLFKSRDIVESELQVHIDFWILTNGTILNNEIITILKHNPCGISISMDGGRDFHNKVRRINKNTENIGSWDTIWQNIDSLQKEGITPYILTTVTEDNVESLPHFAELLISRNIGLRLSLVRDLHSYALETSREKISFSIKKTFNMVAENLTDTRMDKYIKFAEIDLDAVKKGRACSAGRNSYAIDHNGNYSLCQMYFDKPIANILNGQTEILENLNPTSQNLGGVRRNGYCSECQWQWTCAGACPRHAHDVFGSPDAPSPWCSLYKELIPQYIDSIGRQMLTTINSKKEDGQ